MLHWRGLKESLLLGSMCSQGRGCRGWSSSLLLLLSSKSVRKKPAFYHKWANKKKVPIEVPISNIFSSGSLGISKDGWVGGWVCMLLHIGGLLFLLLQYKLGHVPPFDFPFFCWDEEMKRKEGNKQIKKQLSFTFVCHSKFVRAFWGEGKWKIFSRQLIIPCQPSLERSCAGNCFCHPLPVFSSPVQQVL